MVKLKYSKLISEAAGMTRDPLVGRKSQHVMNDRPDETENDDFNLLVYFPNKLYQDPGQLHHSIVLCH